MMVRMFLSYQEKRIPRDTYMEFLSANRDVLEKISGEYSLAVHGYIVVMLREEEAILDFFRETEPLKLPPLGVTLEEVENYIMVQFVKSIYTNREEDKRGLGKLIETYGENGYQRVLCFPAWAGA